MAACPHKNQNYDTQWYRSPNKKNHYLLHNHSGLSSESSLHALIRGEADTSPALMRALGHHPARLRRPLQINIVPDVTHTRTGKGKLEKGSCSYRLQRPKS